MVRKQKRRVGRLVRRPITRQGLPARDVSCPVCDEKWAVGQELERLWDMVVQAVTAMAQDRGWVHQSANRSRFFHLKEVVSQLGKETGDRDLFKDFSLVEGNYTNYFGNRRTWTDVKFSRESAKRLVDKLMAICESGPGSFTIGVAHEGKYVEEGQARLALLLGVSLPGADGGDREGRRRVLNRLFPPKTTSSVGFSPNYGYRLPDINAT